MAEVSFSPRRLTVGSEELWRGATRQQVAAGAAGAPPPLVTCVAPALYDGLMSGAIKVSEHSTCPMH